MKVIKT
jgi:hypothetical protein